jgi:type I restriction enzyme S subunit
MEVTPGYKQTEVGVIPEDWECTNVRDIASPIRNAIVGGPFGSDLVSSDYVEDGVPVVRGQNMGARFVSGGFAFVTKAKASSLEANLARPADLIFTQRGTLGQVSLVPDQPHDRYLVSQSQMKLTVNRRAADPLFFYYVFSSSQQQEFIRQSTIQTGVPHINLGILRSIPMQRPLLAEQEAIAEALSDADALIESLEQLIAKKRQLKQGAMQELLPGKKRLPGFEVTRAFKQTEVGTIPADWEVEKLAAICSMKSGEGITSADIDQFSKYPCYGGNGLRGFTTRFTHDGRYSLIGRQGALCGNVLGVEGKLFASEHAIVVTASARTDTRWLTFVLGEMRLNQYSESSAQPGLSVSKLLSLHVAHPPIRAEQESIATILSDMGTEVAALEAKLAKARQLKQGMMQELLTGRIRLI